MADLIQSAGNGVKSLLGGEAVNVYKNLSAINLFGLVGLAVLYFASIKDKFTQFPQDRIQFFPILKSKQWRLDQVKRSALVEGFKWNPFAESFEDDDEDFDASDDDTESFDDSDEDFDASDDDTESFDDSDEDDSEEDFDDSEEDFEDDEEDFEDDEEDFEDDEEDFDDDEDFDSDEEDFEDDEEDMTEGAGKKKKKRSGKRSGSKKRGSSKKRRSGSKKRSSSKKPKKVRRSKADRRYDSYERDRQDRRAYDIATHVSPLLGPKGRAAAKRGCRPSYSTRPTISFTPGALRPVLLKPKRSSSKGPRPARVRRSRSRSQKARPRRA